MTKEDDDIFASLHYFAKYCFVLIETISSLKLVTGNIKSRLSTSTGTSSSTSHPACTYTRSARESSSSSSVAALPDNDDANLLNLNLNNNNLLDSILYTQNLLESTHLRLDTLRRRIKNAIHLAFNLGADKDTKVMMDDSHAMTVISFMTAALLPATAVASILGSNMFASTDKDEDMEGAWQVKVNASFWMWCVVALPVTACLVALLFARYIKKEILRLEFPRCTFGRNKRRGKREMYTDLT